MRLYRNTIILAFVLAILVAAYIWLPKPGNEQYTSNSGQDTGIVLVPADRTKFLEIERTGTEGKVVLARKDNEFVVAYPAGASVIPVNSNDFIDSLSQLKAARIINAAPASCDEYGLSEPQASVKIKTDDGNVIVLHIGDQTYSKENCYVRKDGDNTVYAISWHNAENLLKNLLKSDAGVNEK